MAAQKEFTVQDIKKAFEAGARLGPGSWQWQRWMRNQYPARYVRKAQAAKMKTKCDWKCPACGADFGNGFICTNGHHIVSRGRYAGRKLLDRQPKAQAAGAGN